MVSTIPNWIVSIESLTPANTPWVFVLEVNEICNKVISATTRYSKTFGNIYKHLFERFNKAIDPVIQELGSCCVQKYSFDPLALRCDAK